MRFLKCTRYVKLGVQLELHFPHLKHKVSQTFSPGFILVDSVIHLLNNSGHKKRNLVHNRGSQKVPFLCYFLRQIISRFVSPGVRFQQLKVPKTLWTRKAHRKGSRKCSVESRKFIGLLSNEHQREYWTTLIKRLEIELNF